MKDIGASVLARLKNEAKESGRSYQQCLQLFFQEEFLRRLAYSPYVNNLVLKGGLFIYTLTNFESRPTIDIDFLLQRLSNELALMDKIISEIINTPTENHFIKFEAKTAEPIAQHRKYHGMSTQIIGKINNVRVPFTIDIGVDDIIIPGAQLKAIHTQLKDYKAPKIMMYSLESTIAEKFDAILQRFELTGRMKDFYDIYYLSNAFEFDGRKLQEAIWQTLQHRGTVYEKDSLKRILSLATEEGMLIKWRYFLKTLKADNLPFGDVMNQLITFLEPIFTAIMKEDEWIRHWDSKTSRWI